MIEAVKSVCTRVDANRMPSDCTMCLTDTLTWGLSGGFVAYTDQSSLAPCAHYVHTRTPANGSAQAALSCEADLAACDARSGGAVSSALANADVKAALAASPMLFGVDQRAWDGSVFDISVGAHTIEVGGSCDGAPPNCIPVPAGVQALVDVLNAIDKQELSSAACQGFGM